MPESGGDWSFRTVSIKGSVIFSAIKAAGRGGRTTVKNRLKVAAAGAGRVCASMVASGVVEAAEEADGIFGLASWCDVANTSAVPARGIMVGGVSPLNGARPGEMSD